MAFATHQQLAARWRTLDSTSQAQADILLEDASRDLTREYPAAVANPDLTLELERIVCNMVRREMIRLQDDADGVASQTDTQGPFSSTRRYLDGEGGMYVTAREERILLGDRAATESPVPLWGE